MKEDFLAPGGHQMSLGRETALVSGAQAITLTAEPDEHLLQHLGA
jgi:hypothetical protein